MAACRARVKVGTCGFAEAQARLFAGVDVVEVQQTFYDPPARTSTAQRWRERAGPGFAFTVKAWQLVTHEPTSPTYRRLRRALPASARAEAGGLRWNDTTRWAWARTQEIADACGAEAVVVQLPASFTPTEENLDRVRAFFSQADRRGRRMVFEPRGHAWTADLVGALAGELDLVHAVDPFLAAPASAGPRYFRLHGRPAYNYRYRYTDDDLAELEGLLPAAEPAWVLFNNDAMAGDARRLKARLAGGGGGAPAGTGGGAPAGTG